MRRAMASAEVGDDVYGEDPTINRLEARAAEIFGREAAIFVPSGTMGNQIAIKLHTRPGQEILCEERGHIFHWEMAMLGWFSGCMVRPVSCSAGNPLLGDARAEDCATHLLRCAHRTDRDGEYAQHGRWHGHSGGRDAGNLRAGP